MPLDPSAAANGAFLAWRLGATGIPDAVRDLALTGLIDTVGVALAGSREPCAALIPVAGDPAGPRLLTTFGRADVACAALINGTAAHALDFDDVSGAYDGHPSSVIVPALLAIGEREGSPGAAVLDAYALGLEFSAAVGYTLGHWHYARGFHATSVVGPMAAALGCALLLGADAARTAHAVGIAASYGGGLRKNFGTMTKPYHVGLAARAGVEAARLAMAGFTADPSILEGPLGFFDVFGAAGPLADSTAFGGGRWLTADLGIAFKRYGACYQLSRPLDAALELAGALGPRDEIRSVRAVIGAGGMTALIHDHATTGLQGKFSLRYAVCAALVDRTVGLSTFTDEHVRSEAIQSLMQRFSVQEQRDDAAAFRGVAESGRAEISVELADGRVRTAVVTVPRGSPGAPFDAAQVDAKFLDAASKAIGGKAPSLLRRLRDVRSLPDVALLWEGL